MGRYERQRMNYLALLAAASADANQNMMGVIIGVSLVTALLTSLFVVFAYGRSLKRDSSASDEEGNEAQYQEMIQETVTPAASEPLAVHSGVSDEIVAVIAAAVASMAPEGKQYRVKSVSRVRSQRSVWAAAGLAENTRPF